MNKDDTISKDDVIEKLKSNYNYWINRYKKAEKYFDEYEKDEEKKLEECLKYLGLFDSVVQSLSALIIMIEEITNRPMTKDEKFNGFNKLGGD